MKITRQRSTGRALTPFAGLVFALAVSVAFWIGLVSWVS